MSIRDFFKPKVTVNTNGNGENNLAPSLNETKKNNGIMVENEDSPRAESGKNIKSSNKTVIEDKAKSVKIVKSNSSSPKKKATMTKKGKTAFIIDDSDSSDQELFNSIPDTLEEFISVKKSPAKKSKSVKKEEAFNLDSDEDMSDEEEEAELNEEGSPKKSKPVKRVTKSKIVSEAKKNKTEMESIETSAISESEATPKKKFNYHAYLAKRTSAPIAPGSKEIPEGSPNCLEGLAFVFSGDLSSISRDDVSDLVKRYGARVTTAPSGKTSYVVLGENAGASKLEKIEKLNLKTLDEDGLFELIKSKSKLSNTDNLQVKPKPPVTILSPKKTISKASTDKSLDKEIKNYDLWTVKWAPKRPEDLIGNHSIYEKLKSWLLEWKNGIPSEFRAVLLSGPPGIGKTSMAHMVCKAVGFDVVELNASDTRSKKTLHDEVREVINNSSLAGFFKPKSSHESATGDNGSKIKKQCIIMDECDGMSAGDRGGMAELIQLIKKTKVPIICACNDRSSPKVRSLANYCMDLRFRRPDARQVVPRITEICRQEGLTVGPNTIEELVASTQGDIRQILNLLSTYRLTGETLNFDESKKLGIASKKDIDEGPFDSLHALLSGQSFNRMTLNQKIDLYFTDSGLMPLMIHENYLKSRANTSRTVYDNNYGAINGANFMTLAWAAADSISKSDEVDSLIRGYNQEWSLAPLHAIHSCVRPAYFCSGNLSGRVDFPGWLGQNSKLQKYLRILKELTQHLYLHMRANKLTLCMDYAPTMGAIILNRLQSVESIDKAIEFLDDYALAKEDLEPLLEIILDSSCNSQAYAKLPTTLKSAFTRKYNQGSHLLPYALGASAVPIRKIKSDVKIADSNEEEIVDDENFEANESGDEADEDISKDKMIKSNSKGSKSKSTAVAKRGGKGKK